MTKEEIAATAQKMIALYGPDAEAVADGQAETHAECEEVLEMLDWSEIAARICELQACHKSERRTA